MTSRPNQSIAAHLTPLLANESDPLKVHKTIDDEMRRALTLIAGSEVSEATL